MKHMLKPPVHFLWVLVATASLTGCTVRRELPASTAVAPVATPAPTPSIPVDATTVLAALEKDPQFLVGSLAIGLSYWRDILNYGSGPAEQGFADLFVLPVLDTAEKLKLPIAQEEMIAASTPARGEAFVKDVAGRIGVRFGEQMQAQFEIQYLTQVADRVLMVMPADLTTAEKMNRYYVAIDYVRAALGTAKRMQVAPALLAQGEKIAVELLIEQDTECTRRTLDAWARALVSALRGDSTP